MEPPINTFPCVDDILVRTNIKSPFACAQFHPSHTVMDRLQTNGELQDKTSFIHPSTGVDLLKGCSPDYLLL